MSKKKKLTLFRVTLDWQQNDPEQGDYCTSVWAKDDDEAIRLVAEEMADHPDAGCDTKKERADFAAARIAEAGPYGTESVAAGLLRNIETLIAGPDRNMTKPGRQDYALIETILKKYGATP